MNLDDLNKPFPAKDIEWRIQQSGIKNGKPYAMVLAYVTNRAIMDRLDEVCGPDRWRNEFTAGPNGGVLCGISILVSLGMAGEEWVTKWDGAENTDIESVKGGLSNAMKRAAVQWGIGRYLYSLEAGWAVFTDKGTHRDGIKDKEGKKVWYDWNPPDLPAWALPDNEPVVTTVEEKAKESSAATESGILTSKMIERVRECKALPELENVKKVFKGEGKSKEKELFGAAKRVSKPELDAVKDEMDKREAEIRAELNGAVESPYTVSELMAIATNKGQKDEQVAYICYEYFQIPTADFDWQKLDEHQRESIGDWLNSLPDRRAK